MAELTVKKYLAEASHWAGHYNKPALGLVDVVRKAKSYKVVKASELYGWSLKLKPGAIILDSDSEHRLFDTAEEALKWIAGELEAGIAKTEKELTDLRKYRGHVEQGLQRLAEMKAELKT